MNDGDIVRQIATEIGGILHAIDRKEGWSASIYAQACYMAGLQQLRREWAEGDVIELLREQADQSEAVLRHAFNQSGKVVGKPGE